MEFNGIESISSYNGFKILQLYDENENHEHLKVLLVKFHVVHGNFKVMFLNEHL